MEERTETQATGLEDEDNFFELIRQRAGLDTREEALSLAAEVVLYVACWLEPELSREFLTALPKAVEDYVYPRLFHDDTAFRPSLWRLERELQRSRHIDSVAAARQAGAVGLAISERVPSVNLEPVVGALPPDLRELFALKTLRAAA